MEVSDPARCAEIEAGRLGIDGLWAMLGEFDRRGARPSSLASYSNHRRNEPPGCQAQQPAGAAVRPGDFAERSRRRPGAPPSRSTNPPWCSATMPIAVKPEALQAIKNHSAPGRRSRLSSGNPTAGEAGWFAGPEPTIHVWERTDRRFLV